MKIYAIRDRLIDYYMQPFVGPDDKSVLASVARLVNQGEVTSDIAQAPHHFEVWKLGSVTEKGHLVPERELIQDCAALIRTGLRTGVDPGARQAQERAPESSGGPNGTPHTGGAPTSPLQGQTPGQSLTAHQTVTGYRRSDSRTV